MLDPVGFWSYGRHDDEHSGGALSQLRNVVGNAINLQHGAKVKLFQDSVAITFGADWAAEIERAIGQTNFYLPIVTPRFLKSRNCHAEFQAFRRRMEALGYDDLIFPVHYVDVEEMSVEDTAFGDDLDLLRRSQWIDFRPLFYADPHSAEVRQWAGGVASSILRTVRLHRIAEARERARREQAAREAEERQRREEAERREADERERQAEAARRATEEREREEAARRATENRQREQEAEAKRATAERERRERAKREAEERERQEIESKSSVAEPISDEQQAEPGRKQHLLAKIVFGLTLAISVALVSWFASITNTAKLELVELDPIKLDPIPDPVNLDPIKQMGLITLDPIKLAEPIKVDPIKLDQIPDPIKPESLKSDPIELGPIKPELIKLCDRLAAAPSDPDRPAHVAAVSLDAIDGKAAIQACRAAHEVAPNERRIAFQLGRAFGASNQFDEARVYYVKAADGGSSAAMSNLGVLYDRGQGIAQDYAAARKWYEKAADLGNSIAMFNLGSLYANGHGVAQDYYRARSWYYKAADLEYPDAMDNLGELYYYGRGVALNYDAARRWYEKAADRGHAGAMYSLGFLYENGQGVAKDYAAARSWYEKAAKLGNTDAKQHLEDIEDKK